ncbi:hypothetical protein WG936_08145 [Corynebacterium sp. H127]|uniref:hypothetical protein n=1 Tax=Corynebacterium sp. H127 TaxID=3133418 RepID=UPI0030A976CE
MDLFESLGRALYWLSVDADALDELLVPRQPTSGENAGKPPNLPGSKPPLSIPMLQLKTDTEQVVHRWCWLLSDSARDVVGLPLDSVSLARRAQWLSFHLETLESMPWFDRAAEELIAQGNVVADVVRPPSAENDPLPIEVGTAREIASWTRHLGRRVSRTTIQRWARQGVIPSEVAPDGRLLVRLADVLDQVPIQTILSGPPHAVS